MLNGSSIVVRVAGFGPEAVDLAVPAELVHGIDRFARGDVIDRHEPRPPARARRPGPDGRITALRSVLPTGCGPSSAALVAPALVSPERASTSVGFPMATLATSALTAAVAVRFFSPIFALLAGISALAVVGRWVGSKMVSYRAGRRRRSALALAARSWEEVSVEWAEAEAATRRSRHGEPSALMALLTSDRSPWSERIEPDHDLVVSLGTGTVAAPVDVAPADAVSGTVAPASLGLATEVDLVGVPIPASIRPVDGMAICGDRHDMLAAARWLVASTATRFGPADLGLLVIATADRVIDWDWVKWLPSLRCCLVVEVDQLDRLVDECGARPLLVVVDGAEPVGASPLARLLAGRMAGARLVWLGSAAEVPGGCGTRLDVMSDGSGTVHRPGGSTSVEWHGLTVADADSVARWLAPFDDPEVIDEGGRLPERVSIEQVVFDGVHDREETIRRSWERATPRSLAAPIGVGVEGPDVIDLVVDGPHCLAAGTTGSGKSELLRTMVVGIASAHPPSNVSFVLVDFKGGGAFDAVADLPHVAAVVTDLDSAEAGRALRGLRAELLEREHRLRDMECSDVADIDPTHPRAFGRLVVVVDEFAALAHELPDFLDGLVDIARRGRSLGVHLVLATQRPSGVVTGQIRSNTNLRICLRVQDRADSADVIDRPDAALLSAVPGRAFVQRGGEGCVPVQVAHIDPPREGPMLERFVVHPTLLDSCDSPGSGRPDHDPDPVAEMAGWFQCSSRAAADLRSGVDTSSASLVAGIVELGERLGAARASSPWNAPLEPIGFPVSLEGLPATGAVGTAAVDAVLGLVDDPDRRRVLPLTWRPERDGLLIVGVDDDEIASSAATAVCAAVDRPGPAPSVFVLDGRRGGAEPLRRLDRLDPVIDVVGVEEPERLLRAVGHIGRVEGPRLVVINEWQAVADGIGDVGGPGAVEQLVRLVRQAGTATTAVIVTARSDRAVPQRAACHLGCRVVHRLGDPAGYLSFGLRLADAPRPFPGAAIDGTSGLHAIIAAVDRSSLESLRRRLDDRAPAVRPGPVRVLGGRVDRSVLPAPKAIDDGWRLPIGLDADLEPVWIDARPTRPVVVLGHPGGGRSTAVHTMTAAAEVHSAVTVIDDAELLDDAELEQQISRAADDASPLVLACGPAVARRFGSPVAPLLATATVVVLNPGRVEAEVVRASLPDLSQQPIGRAAVVDRGRVRVVQVAAGGSGRA